MCRMVLALGTIDAGRIIDAAIEMALDQTTLHEYNQKPGKGSWQHGDGWGLAYLDHNNNWIIRKSTTAIFDDKKIEQLRNIKTRLLLLHVRRKAGSDKSLQNTHPFVAKDLILETNVPETYLFCHNGFIDEEIAYDKTKYRLLGKTDSEKLFYSILTDLKDDKNMVKVVRNNFKRYKKLNGTNLILSKNNRSVVAVRKNKFPIYYQMQMAKTKDSLIFSSERLPLAEFKWQPLEQGDIVTIHHKNLTYSVNKGLRK